MILDREIFKERLEQLRYDYIKCNYASLKKRCSYYCHQSVNGLYLFIFGA
ncbi:MAG: hypothetical protein ACI35O_13030 [Bacillaceae bacterium]